MDEASDEEVVAPIKRRGKRKPMPAVPLATSVEDYEADRGTAHLCQHAERATHLEVGGIYGALT